ncbi:uncharacterized protein TrAFT101_003467 [Trichoderma asperellum]|uniref:uncharacterized protein n=1 Tax=Trichoderma asperellum TaxID=101201 RepID=UPI00332DEF47|nr:hypothetical protein TrAFT101_003467 [Trichoderma asperellum]
MSIGARQGLFPVKYEGHSVAMAKETPSPHAGKPAVARQINKSTINGVGVGQLALEDL